MRAIDKTPAGDRHPRTGARARRLRGRRLQERAAPRARRRAHRRDPAEGVTVCPDGRAPAPILITISNQTDNAHTVPLEGDSRGARGPIHPHDTATIQKTLTPGTYEIRAGPERRGGARDPARRAEDRRDTQRRPATRCCCPSSAARPVRVSLVCFGLRRRRRAAALTGRREDDSSISAGARAPRAAHRVEGPRRTRSGSSAP